MKRIIAPRLSSHLSSIDDVAQETWMNAWRSRKTFRYDSSFETWMHKIATNTAQMFLRKTYGTDYSREDILSLEEAHSYCLCRNNDLNSRIDESRMRKAVRAAVDKVPQKYRVHGFLDSFEGIPPCLQSELLGMPEGTVKALCFRGRVIAGMKLMDSPVFQELYPELLQQREFLEKRLQGFMRTKSISRY